MKLGGFIVTYHRPADLQRSLEALLRQTRAPEHLLIVDNGGDDETKQVVANFPAERVSHEFTGSNLGSAGGTEYGVRRVAAMGYPLIFNGDDDNPPRTDDTIERLLDLIDVAPAEVGAVGTVGARFDWGTGRLRRFRDEELVGVLDVDFIGGDHKMILKRETVEKGGPPDGRLFFGYPDLEHCLRLRQAGWRLQIDGALMLEYRRLVGKLGQAQKRSIVPQRSLQDSWRYYYTTRNYIHMMRETFGRPDLARREVAAAIGRAGGSWVRGPQYGAVVSARIFKGLIDGFFGVRGGVLAPAPKGVSAETP